MKVYIIDILLNMTNNIQSYHNNIIKRKYMGDTGFIRIENALLKKPNYRIPCFPLIDAAFASSCSAGIRFAWIGEGLGSGSLISPEQYKEFVLPFEKIIADRFRSQGVLTFLHICGNTTNAPTYIARSGVDGFDLDYPVDITVAVDALYPEITIKGNINPGLFLPGRSEELERACRDTIAVAKNLNNFIFSTGCLVPRDSSKEAFYTMQDHVVYNRRSRSYGYQANRRVDDPVLP